MKKQLSSNTYVYSIGVSYVGIRKPICDYIVKELRPKVVLDLGCGSGAYGYDLKMRDPSITMIGLDGHFRYLTSHHCLNCYDIKIHASIDQYFEYLYAFHDVALCMDVVEHMEKEKAIEFLDQFHGIISTPLFWFEQGPVEGNEFEIHKCWFTEEELNDLGYVTLFKVDYDERGQIGAFEK